MNTNYNFLFLNVNISNFFLNKVLIGSKKICWNSYNKPFGAIFLKKVCVFSFESLYFCYRKALFFVFRLFASSYNKFVFFVNGLPFNNKCIFSFRFSQQFFRRVTRSRFIIRWVPGLLTNFKVVNFFIKLGKKKYNKNHLAKIKNKFGLRQMTKLKTRLSKKTKELVKQLRFPNLVFFFSNAYYLQFAVEEVYKFSIPSIGVVDSDTSFNLLSFPIPGNDDSFRSVLVYLKIFSESIFRGVTLNLFKEKIFLNLKSNSFLKIKLQKKRIVYNFYKNLRLSLYFTNLIKLKQVNFKFYYFEFISKLLVCFERIKKILFFLLQNFKKINNIVIFNCIRRLLYKNYKKNNNRLLFFLYNYSTKKIKFFYYKQLKKLQNRVFVSILLKKN